MNANERNRNADLRDQPAYALAEASRYLKLPAATLRSWVVGRPYTNKAGTGHTRPLIHPPKKQPLLLTFWNLIEAHVMRSLRTEHDEVTECFVTLDDEQHACRIVGLPFVTFDRRRQVPAPI